MVPTSPTWKYVASRLGTFHSWWLPGTPVDGYYDNWSKATRGYTTLPLRHRKVNGKYITGGPWNLFKETHTYSGEKVDAFRHLVGKAYSGRYWALDTPPGVWGLLQGMKNLEDAYKDCAELGAEAWASMKPASPDFSAAQELYELRDWPQFAKGQCADFLFNIRKEKKGRRTYDSLSHTGKWYLALQFGWLPILRSIENGYDTFLKRKAIFDQLLRDEGRWKYRSRSLKSHDVNTSTSSTASYPTMFGHPSMRPTHVSQCYAGGASDHVVDTFSSRAWCVGKFKYFLPAGPRDRNWESRIMRRIFGLRVTPEQVYNIIPWSWLFDYYTDLGHFMSAVSGGVEERLICDYAYVMQHTRASRTLTRTQMMYGDATASPEIIPATAVTTVVQETKTRAKATVLGFGLAKGDLSPFQWSILGALGLSRL
nr:MAG: hypothetical protein 1 [Leviviridae sp.]